jgi:hypothetical protein
VVVGVSPPAARTAAVPPPATSAPPATSSGETPPPATNPTGAAPDSEPITRPLPSAIGASGPPGQRPSDVTTSVASLVRASEDCRSVAEM